MSSRADQRNAPQEDLATELKRRLAEDLAAWKDPELFARLCDAHSDAADGEAEPWWRVREVLRKSMVLRTVETAIVKCLEDAEDDDTGDPDDDDDDDNAYTEEHVAGREWTEIATTSNSRTYAMEVIVGKPYGVIVRTTSWGDDMEFASAMVVLPGISLEAIVDGSGT